jgi:hypothetical protein
LLRFSRMTLADMPVIRQFYRPNFGDYTFTDGWQNILIGMNHLPFDFNQFQGAGPNEEQIVRNLGLAEKRFADQEHFKKTEIPRMPSHYEYLRDHIYGGQE